MKLVAAKCPNCGANIDVDKDSESTKCEFCKSKIIVDDAIAKYKVEISGKIEVENLPKIENYMKLGDRYFEDKEYHEAQKQYEKACELDPDNPKAVLRKGLSKAYSSSYGQFDLKSALNGMKNAYKLWKKEKADSQTINTGILECYELIDTKQNQTMDFYRENQLNLDGVNLAITRIRMCVAELEYLKIQVENDPQLVVKILNAIIDGLSFLVGNLHYYDGVNANGQPKKMMCSLKDITILKKTLKETIAERNSLDPNAAKEYEQKKEKENQSKKTLKILGIILGILLGILILLIIIVASSNHTAEAFEKKWVSDEMTIEFLEKNKVLVTGSDGVQTEYDYERVCEGINSSCDISIIEGQTHKYELYFRDATEANGNEQTLCLKEGEECKVFFD